jgi:cyclopropane-fatty-acyl-phospholipid synthase
LEKEIDIFDVKIQIIRILAQPMNKFEKEGFMWYWKLLHTNMIPDAFIRLVVRQINRRAIKRLEGLSLEEQEQRRRSLLEKLDRSPIAIHTDLPNVQHYEVPPAFFNLVLGKRLKYSCCYWPEGVTELDQAEEKMLDLTCQRAQLEDGMSVLDLGCGWGSLSLWIAEHYPTCQILAVSNSRDQIAWIRERARERGFQNVDASVVDVNQLVLDRRFDRVISMEMFEHMKNYRRLMAKIGQLLTPRGKLFVHIFSHRQFAYEFEAEESSNWMAQTFFTGGTMPSDDLLLHYQDDLRLVDHWRISGLHYAKTLRAWLDKMDDQKTQVQEVLADAYGPDQVKRWWVNWRLFFLACEENWACRAGREYLVSHYLFENRRV